MTNFDINELAALAEAALAEQELGQEYLLSDVHNITRQAYERYTEDPIIRQFAFVIERKTEREGPHSTINQREMTSIYNDISRLGSTERFRKALGALVSADEPDIVRTNDEFVRMNRVDADNTGLSTDEYMDPDLVDALEGAFGGSMPKQKTHDVRAAAKGAEFLQLELESLGFKSRIEVLGGNHDTLVYAAHLDTQNGLVSVAIPLDISQGKVLLPSTFVANDRLENLTAGNLQYFIDKKAYTNDFSMPNADTILKAVGVMTGRDVIASDDEFASTLERFDERGEVVHMNTPELFTKQQNAPKAYIDTTPDVEMPKELAHLAQDFESDLLEAASNFGKDAINAGKQMLVAELAVAGFKNAQIKYGTEDDSSIVYLAAFQTPRGPSEIAVPVEMHSMGESRHVPLAPTSFAWQGESVEFTADNLQRFSVAHPYGHSVSSSAHTHMNLAELKDEMLKAVAASDYQSCEMILEAVNQRFGEDTYKNVVADYHYIIMLKHSHEQEERPVCNKQIAAGKGSVQARCGHFGVSMSKVVVGEDGHCRLKTALEREKMNPVEKGGASISSNKLFLT